MVQIDVDLEVFEFLQKNAKPFVDTPNTVLRRLLRIDGLSSCQNEKGDSVIMPSNTEKSKVNTNEFVKLILGKEFSERFHIRSPYRLMFESDNILIYFQNFNQESATLWYRVTAKALQVLTTSRKKSFICLTNPAESIAYLIPIEEIKKHIASSNWSRDYLEINIDHLSCKWKELNWNIQKFLKKY